MSASYRLQSSDCIAIGADAYRFVGRTRDEKHVPRFQDVRSGAERLVTDEELGKLLERMDGARFITEEEARAVADGGEVPEGSPISLLDDIRSDKERERCRRLARYCEAWSDAGEPALSDRRLQPLIDEVAKAAGHSDKEKPTTRTLRTWIPRWENARLAGLVSRASQRGRKIGMLAEAIQIALDVIWDFHLSQRRPTVHETATAVKERIKERNKARAPSEPAIAAPTKRQVETLINKIPQPTRVAYRDGVPAAEAKFGPRTGGVRTTRPNERWEMDATVCDVMAIHPETGEAMGRPTIVVVIDCHTRLVVGIYIGFIPESLPTAIMALRQAIRPKDAIHQRFPHLVHRWEAEGMPETVVVDNHSAYGKGLAEALVACGVKIARTPVLKAWWKGTIERFFNTLTHKTFQRMPGSTFSNVYERSHETPPETVAAATLPEIERAIYTYLIDEYPYDVHRGLQIQPALAYRKAVATHGVIPSPGAEALSTSLAVADERTLQPYGFQIENCFYGNPGLDPAGPRRRVAPKYRVALDPYDMDAIKVLDPAADRWVTARRYKPAIMPGVPLTMEANAVTRSLLAREAERFLDENDTDGGFRRAHDYVVSYFDAIVRGSAATQRQRRRAAGYLEQVAAKRQRDQKPPVLDRVDEAASAVSPSDELFGAGIGDAGPVAAGASSAAPFAVDGADVAAPDPGGPATPVIDDPGPARPAAARRGRPRRVPRIAAPAVNTLLEVDAAGMRQAERTPGASADDVELAALTRSMGMDDD